MNFCSWKDRKAVAADLRPIYEAPTAEEAARQLDTFEEKWVGKYPSIAPAWRRAWAEVTPFYAFSAAIRKIIYTTNAVESLNFEITFIIAMVVSALLTLLLVGLVGLIAFPIAWLVLRIVASVQTSNGNDYRYPATLRLVK